MIGQEVHNGRSVATVLADMKEELKDFVATRFALLKAEMREKLKMLKVAIPMAAIALVLLGTAYLLFTMTLVSLIVALLPENSFRWCLAFLSVAVVWSILGGIAAYLAKRELVSRGLMPEKTISVLKGDKIWIQSEVKSQS